MADQVECNLGDKSLVKGLVHRLAEGGADATEIQALLGHESLNMSQGSIDATANRTRQAARANRTYRSLEKLTRANTPTGRKAGQREGSRATALPGVPG